MRTMMVSCKASTRKGEMEAHLRETSKYTEARETYQVCPK
jgi:hypothetical protein